MTQQDGEKIVASLSVSEQLLLLSLLGHELTVFGRTAYEFQGLGVVDPRLLRDLNEIQHRIHGQLVSLTRSDIGDFPPEALASWLFGEDKPELQMSLSHSFERALQRFKTVA